MSSMRATLLVGTTVAVAAALVVAGVALQALIERSLVAELDRGLLEQARLLASTVEEDEDGLDVELEDLDLRELDDPAGGWFLQLWGPGGETLHRSRSLGPAQLAPRGAGAAWVALATGERLRAVALEFAPRDEHDRGAGPRPATTLSLVLARRTRELDHTLATSRSLLLLVGATTLLVAGGALTTIVHRALRPLDRVSRGIAEIRASDLAARVDESQLPTELRPVVQRVNELLSHLEAAFARERAFSAEVAHELRTPLAGLRATLEVTLSRPRSADEHAEASRQALRVVEQLHGMVERLLLLARLDAGQVARAAERVDLAELVVELWEPFARAAADRGLVVAYEVDEAGVELDADRALLTVILRNLYENAVTYADVGGRVRVTVRRRDTQASLEVSNTGSRLTQDDAHAAVQRFWRGEAARTEAGLHCGLGLSLVEEASLALGGRLVLRSERGGEFTAALRLPLVAAAPLHPAAT